MDKAYLKARFPLLMLVFPFGGIFGLIEMYGLVPLEEKFQKRFPKAFNIVTIALFGLFALDIVLSLTIK